MSERFSLPPAWGFDPAYLCESMTAAEWIWAHTPDTSKWTIMPRPRKSVQEIIREIEAVEGEGFFKLPLRDTFRSYLDFAKGDRVGVVIDGVVHVAEVGSTDAASPLERAGEILGGLVRVIPGGDNA